MHFFYQNPSKDKVNNPEVASFPAHLQTFNRLFKIFDNKLTLHIDFLPPTQDNLLWLRKAVDRSPP